MTEEQAKIELENFIVQFIVINNWFVSEIKTDSKLRDDLGMDSLDVRTLYFDIEKEYDISISDEFSEEWGKMTIDEISDQIKYLLL